MSNRAKSIEKKKLIRERDFILNQAPSKKGSWKARKAYQRDVYEADKAEHNGVAASKHPVEKAA